MLLLLRCPPVGRQQISCIPTIGRISPGLEQLGAAMNTKASAISSACTARLMAVF